MPVDLLALMNSLYDRRLMAVVVPYEPTSMKSDSPREGECHNNADRYVLENPDCKSIRGWLVFDNATALVFRSRPHFRFTSHSVVERADGRLSGIATLPIPAAVVKRARKASSTLSLQRVTPNPIIRSEEPFSR